MTPWREFSKKKKYPSLKKNISADVVIIGGGMAGILSAYQLSKAGKKVALLERKELGAFATMDTTAFITEVIDSDLSQISSIFDEKTAKDVWHSGREAIEEFQKIIEEESIDCEFVRCPNYVFASKTKQFKSLEEEYDRYEKLGLEAKLHNTGDELGFPNYGYLEVPNQAKFHPTKFLYALAEAARKYGAQIFENTPAQALDGDGPIRIKTPTGSVTADNVIIATYKPFTHEKTHLKKAMYRSYVFELESPKGIFEEALYEDMSNPYYYFRVDPQQDFDRVIIGGDDHKDIFGKTLVKQSFKSLKEFTDKLFQGEKYKIRNKWNGPILEPSDGLALIGEIKPHHYVATGFSGNGMTYSMISSLIIRDLILGKGSVWAKVFDPKRALLRPKRLASKARDYVEEFINGALKNLLK